MGRPIYDAIGTGYNVTRKADTYLSNRLLELLSPKNDGSYLDIGCGTGNYTIKLAEHGIDFHGVDPSDIMLRQAKEKNDCIHWILGSAESIPFEDNFFSGCIATLTIHHWSNLEKSFAELNRALKPESRIVIFTSTSEQMKNYWLNYYFPQMLNKSMAHMPSVDKIINASSKFGLKLIKKEIYSIKHDLDDLFLYSGKYQPELYLDPKIREGISSFTSLANQEEVSLGLYKLSEDIQSGTFEIVSNSFNDKAGDYLFLVFKK